MPSSSSLPADFFDSSPGVRPRRKPGPVPLAEGGKRHSGQFQPGNSGNPTGRPKLTEAVRTFNQLVKEAAPRAVEVLIECMEDPAASWKDRQNAALALVEHSEGKAIDRLQVHQIDGTGGNVRQIPKDVLDQKVANLLAQAPEIDAEYEEITDV